MQISILLHHQYCLYRRVMHQLQHQLHLVQEGLEAGAGPGGDAVPLRVQVASHLEKSEATPGRGGEAGTWASSQFLSTMYWMPADSIMKAKPPCSCCTFSTP